MDNKSNNKFLTFFSALPKRVLERLPMLLSRYALELAITFLVTIFYFLTVLYMLFWDTETLAEFHEQMLGWSLIFAAILLTYLLVIQLFVESLAKKFNLFVRLAPKLAFSAIFVVIVTIAYPPTEMGSFSMNTGYEIFIIWLVGLLLLTIAPFRRLTTAISQVYYCARIVFAGVVAAVFAVLPLLGYFLLLGAIIALLDVDVSWHYFALGAVLSFGVLAPITLFFLIPDGNRVYPLQLAYPKIIVILITFIMTPLILLYTLIIALYGLRILLGEIPEGGVVYVMLTLIIPTLIVYTLLSQFRRTSLSAAVPTQKLPSLVSNILLRLGFISILPISIIYFYAIFYRLFEYSLTVNRYFVLGFGLVIVISAVYLAVSRKQNLKYLVPIIAILLLFSAFGPLSAFTTSLRAQESRLEKLIEQGEAQEGKLSLDAEVSSILDYLDQYHRQETDYFPNDRYVSPARVMSEWGLEYVPSYCRGENYGYCGRYDYGYDYGYGYDEDYSRADTPRMRLSISVTDGSSSDRAFDTYGYQTVQPFFVGRSERTKINQIQGEPGLVQLLGLGDEGQIDNYAFDLAEIIAAIEEDPRAESISQWSTGLIFVNEYIIVFASLSADGSPVDRAPVLVLKNIEYSRGATTNDDLIIDFLSGYILLP